MDAFESKLVRTNGKEMTAAHNANNEFYQFANFVIGLQSFASFMRHISRSVHLLGHIALLVEKPRVDVYTEMTRMGDNRKVHHAEKLL